MAMSKLPLHFGLGSALRKHRKEKGMTQEQLADDAGLSIPTVRLLERTHGNLASNGSVSFMFNRMGVFRLAPEGLPPLDELELELIDHGLQDLGEGTGEKGEKLIILHCNFADFGQLQTALEAKGLHAVSSESEYIPTTTVSLDEEKAKEVLELVDRFEQDDDVQRVFHNLV